MKFYNYQKETKKKVTQPLKYRDWVGLENMGWENVYQPNLIRFYPAKGHVSLISFLYFNINFKMLDYNVLNNILLLLNFGYDIMVVLHSKF